VFTFKKGMASKEDSRDKQFEELIKKAEQKRTVKSAKKKGPSAPPSFLSGLVDLTTAPEIDYNSECGCFGTVHQVINNCMNCGRVICAREGERACPFCGTPVLSDETLQDEEKTKEVVKMIREKVSHDKWVPLMKRDMGLSQEMVKVESKMIDMEKDWFGDELEAIYEDEIEE
jgi:hypothetical protein